MTHRLIAFAATVCMLATAATNSFAADDPLQPIEDVPGLPRVLLVGDSISIGYTLPTRKALSGKANVHRIAANSGTTANTLKNLDKWLGDGHWDVIHMNIGLHDLKYVKGERQVAPDDYEQNLRQIVARLKKTGAKIIWATTTPVPEGAAARNPGDDIKYNAIAAKVMEEEKVAVNDLFALAKQHQAKWQRKADVHFNAAGSQGLGQRVADEILKAL
ncbi:MAG: SGNH/GDSL hydrolase family protein [Pirellulales bacterium]